MSVGMRGEEAAFAEFKAIRWPETNGEPVCVHCGCTEYYDIRTRKRYKCKRCLKQFSATSGTVFASRKLSYQEIIEGFRLANNYQSATILGLSSQLGIEWRTARNLEERVERALLSKSGQFAKRQPTDRSRALLRKSHVTKRPNYPYTAPGQSEAGIDLLHFVDRIVPRGIPEHIRADVCQDIVLDLLEGRLTRDTVKMYYTSKKIRSVFSFYDLTYRTISLDEPITHNSNTSFKDLLSDDHMFSRY